MGDTWQFAGLTLRQAGTETLRREVVSSLWMVLGCGPRGVWVQWLRHESHDSSRFSASWVEGAACALAQKPKRGAEEDGKGTVRGRTRPGGWERAKDLCLFAACLVDAT